VLKRRIPAAIATLAVAFPAVALAATGGNADAPRSADAVKLGRLAVPAKRFEKSIRIGVKRLERQREQSFASLPAGVSIDTLNAIAACESGGDPTAISADGTYRGKYQFDYGTWASVGGSGDPAAAPESEQDYRAALLYAQAGSSPWPVCGV
jgi:hypothetical protein